MAAPVITIYRNGDSHFSGKKLVVNKRQIRNFETLLDKITRDTQAQSAIRSIRTPNHGSRVQNLEHLKHGGAYVAVGIERFKHLQYVDIPKPSHLYRSQPYEKGARSVIQNRLNASARYHKVAIADTLRNRIVYVYQNGEEKAPPVKLLLDKWVLQSMEQVLQHITYKVKLRTGAVKSLFTVDGMLVRSPEEIETGQKYVAVGYGRPFIRLLYADTGIMSITPRRSNQSKYSTESSDSSKSQSSPRKQKFKIKKYRPKNTEERVWRKKVREGKENKENIVSDNDDSFLEHLTNQIEKEFETHSNINDELNVNSSLTDFKLNNTIPEDIYNETVNSQKQQDIDDIKHKELEKIDEKQVLQNKFPINEMSSKSNKPIYRDTENITSKQKKAKKVAKENNDSIKEYIKDEIELKEGNKPLNSNKKNSLPKQGKQSERKNESPSKTSNKKLNKKNKIDNLKYDEEENNVSSEIISNVALNNMSTESNSLEEANRSLISDKENKIEDNSPGQEPENYVPDKFENDNKIISPTEVVSDDEISSLSPEVRVKDSEKRIESLNNGNLISPVLSSYEKDEKDFAFSSDDDANILDKPSQQNKQKYDEKSAFYAQNENLHNKQGYEETADLKEDNQQDKGKSLFNATGKQREDATAVRDNNDTNVEQTIDMQPAEEVEDEDIQTNVNEATTAVAS